MRRTKKYSRILHNFTLSSWIHIISCVSSFCFDFEPTNWQLKRKSKKKESFLFSCCDIWPFFYNVSYVVRYNFHAKHIDVLQMFLVCFRQTTSKTTQEQERAKTQKKEKQRMKKESQKKRKRGKRRRNSLVDKTRWMWCIVSACCFASVLSGFLDVLFSLFPLFSFVFMSVRRFVILDSLL